MIAERVQQDYSSNSKYYQFYTVATILEHVIDCFHTIVSDESNPYHPPLSWLTKKQPKPTGDELFQDLYTECSASKSKLDKQPEGSKSLINLSSSVRSRLERCSKEMRKNIVTRMKDGCSPLFMACKSGHLQIVKYLLETCYVDIEQKGRYEALESYHVHSVSPLWVAAVSGHLSIVNLLISHNANVNSLSDTGSTPLRSVCFLCKEDDGEDEPEHEYMFETNRYGSDDTYFQIVKLLVENGADVSKPNFNGGTCLINSIHNYQLAQYLINNGCDINASDHHSKTALHYAIQQGRVEMTKLLLSNGADPMLKANLCDDALQLSCIGGHIEIFRHLLETVNYTKKRLIDAYKLLGSSVLELHYDLSKVRELWQGALVIQSGYDEFNENYEVDKEKCDNKRRKAFGDIIEFSSELELQSLSADDFRIQSLVISERILGLAHRETLQRLLYRGTSYINSLRPDRCIDLWIYALNLRLQHESIFHIESIFAVKAITKLFLDMLSQGQQLDVDDINDLLDTLVNQLEGCNNHLSIKPVSCLHQDIFDLLLGTIVNLLYALIYATSRPHGQKLTRRIIQRLVEFDPRSSKGSSLLHICLTPGLFDGDVHKLAQKDGVSPMVTLIEIFIENGLEVDSTDNDGSSALQILCLAAVRPCDKKKIINRLVDNGAHIDRRSSSPDHQEVISQALRDAGVDPMKHIKLSCLAARKVSEARLQYDARSLTKGLRKSIAIH